MKSFAVAACAALLAQNVAAHATFQQLWVDGVDFGGQCARKPGSNSPVTNVNSADMRCNAGAARVSAKCPVKAGGTVTVEMHQQHGDRSCNNEAIGGAHYGPVQVYLTKVPDASTADGSTGWFKIYQNSWAKSASGRVGDDDLWGVKDMNKCCGKLDVAIPTSIPSGDYLLRAEAIALHTAGSSGGAQLYMTCFQITVEGGSGSSTPPTVSFPGAYKASDPGIMVNIHGALSTYIAPGPTVIPGGTVKTPGGACTGCESTCKVGSSPSGSPISAPQPTSAPGGGGGGGGGAAPGGCEVPRYGQCGGQGWTGCTTCASGSTCRDVSAPWYSQCQ